jgi:dynein regulatry complex protein 1
MSGTNDHSRKTGSQQVGHSLLNLDCRKRSSFNDVTDIRVVSDEDESKRRNKDEELRRERLSKIQKEAIHSANANTAIEVRWAELLEREIPQELYLEIQAQMEICRTAIKCKDNIIVEFQKQLRKKDEEYVSTLKKQSQDVTKLLMRIRREFVEMHEEYTTETKCIEDAYGEERKSIISEYASEIDGMFDHRKNREVHYKKSKQIREDQYQREIEGYIADGANQCIKLKIDLEKNIQVLKEQLEDIRATYQLNTEKLDYNYRVLTELDVEKNAEMTRYKRRLGKLRDQTNQLTGRYSDMGTADAKTNNELTNDYRSLTQKYKELQAKFRHFEIADSNKYDDVWAMHEEEVKILIDQLLKADKIISEQQLGWKWKGPDINALQMLLGRNASNLPSQAAFTTSSASLRRGDSGIPALDTNILDAVKSTNLAATSRIRGMLQLLASEAGFLVNAEVQESLDNISMSVEDANISRAESMLKALGVQNQQRLDTLLSFFFKDTVAALAPTAFPIQLKLSEDCTIEEEDMDEEELLLHYASEDISELKKMIRPEHVISAVKSYIEDVSLEGGFGAAPGVGGKKVNEEQRIGQKRLNSMRGYWGQLCQVVSEDSVEVWRQLERDSVGLKDLLEKRAKGIEEVDGLAIQNAELKRLLNQYLGNSNVNNHMMVPPGQVMKVRDRVALDTLKIAVSSKADSREKFGRSLEPRYRKSKSAATISTKKSLTTGRSESDFVRVGNNIFPEILSNRAL